MVVLRFLRRAEVRWLTLLLWMALIFFVSDQPSRQLPSLGSWDVIFKKCGHFLAYSVLALLAIRVAAQSKKPWLWAFTIAALYSVSDELHQSFVPTRNGNAYDVLIDCLGAAAALFMLRRERLRQFHWWT